MTKPGAGWWDRDPGTAPAWVEEGYDLLVREMAPPDWEPVEGDDAENSESTMAEGERGGETDVDDDDGNAVDEPRELSLGRCRELLTEYYGTESDAEAALDQLLNRGFFYEVDGCLRVTEPDW